MAGPAYDERLRVPLWWWPLALVAGLALAAELDLDGRAAAVVALPYVAVVVVVTALLLWASRMRVRVHDGELWVDDAHIGVDLLGAAEVLTAQDKAGELGPRLDHLAFLVLRPWVRSAVLVLVTDEADPTPYWIISSRHPDRLVAALDAARSSRRQGHGVG